MFPFGFKFAHGRLVRHREKQFIVFSIVHRVVYRCSSASFRKFHRGIANWDTGRINLC